MNIIKAWLRILGGYVIVIITIISNFFDPALLKVKIFFDSLAFKLLSIFIGAINAYLALCITTDNYGTALKTDWGNKGNWIIENGGNIVFYSVIIAGCYPLFYSYLEKRFLSWEEKYNKLSENYEITVVILEAIEEIVIQKRQRFADLAKKFKAQARRSSAKTMFKEITQPQDQMKTILKSLEICLRKIYPGEYIKLSLVRVKNNALDDWECHTPYNTKPRTNILDLKDPCSTFSYCLREKKMVIIPDTQIELKKLDPTDRLYIAGHTSVDEQWSQLCYPVISINSNEVIFIISLAIKSPNVFNAAGQKSLEWILGFFESRLALEHSLKEIKDLT